MFIIRFCTFLLTALALVSGSLLMAEVKPSVPNAETTKIHPTPPGPNEPVFPLTIEDPFKNNEKFVTDFFSMLSTLGLILAIILLIAWFLKRLTNVRLEQANAGSAIRIIERRNLSQKTLLYLLEVENKIILIAESPTGVTHLSDFPIPPEEEVVTPLKKGTDFSQILEKK